MPHNHPSRRAGAFTLFEVALSLGVLSIAILSVCLAFPVGIKAQQLARLKIYACAKMLEVSDGWLTQEQSAWDQNLETEQLGQNPLMAFPADFDSACERVDSTLIPLPSTIARRFNSDDDEIAKLLDEGGRLFYAPPQPFETGFEEHGGASAQNWEPLPPAAQALVFGVVGYPQQNALPNHPLLAMPYYDWYPSPPQNWEASNWLGHQMAGEAPWAASWNAFNDVWNAIGVQKYTSIRSDRAAVKDAVAKAQALIAALGIPTDDLALVNTPTPPALDVPLKVPRLPQNLSTIATPWDPANPQVFPPAAWILAMRYLAFATTNAWFDTQMPPPAATDDEVAYAKACLEASLQWAMRYAATDPYEWGAPRPMNRATCFDFPLLQFDLLSPAVTTSDGENDQSWLVVGRDKGHDFGRARGVYAWGGQVPDNYANIAASWGNPSHFNLTEPFQASERGRQIVCWSVDWQSYADFESCRSEANDSNRHLIDSRGAQIASEFSKKPTEWQYLWATDQDPRYLVSDPQNALPNGQNRMFRDYTGEMRGHLETPEYKSQWLGLYGADRNGNKVFDQGPLSPNIRLRATTVARFNFYDRRLICAIRH